MAEPQTDSVEREQRVLVLAPTGRDAALTQSLLRQVGIAAEVCPGMEQLCDELRRGAGAVVLAEEALDPSSARTLVRELDAQPPWSDPPLIVLTGRGAVEATQRMATGLGAQTSVTLLERPVQSVTLISAVQSALRARRRQYEVRDLLARLENGVRERDRFLAILSHELRNPLATILGAVSVTEQESRSNDGGNGRGNNRGGFDDEQQQIVARQTRHLARLIDDLLDVSRVTAGKIVLQRRVVDLKLVAQRSLQSVQPMVLAQRHEVTITTCPQPACVEGDSTRLEQVITNLLTNAIKYTPPGGHVRLIIRTQETDALVSVLDDGIGISPESLPLLFEPFVQVDHSLDRSQGGLGLGLSLVQRLVEMHGGTVTANSQGLGKGSEFTVRLPLTAAPTGDPQAEAERQPAPSRRVLLIEDGADARRVMQRLLRLWGHEVEVAENGTEGVRKAIALRPEVALVDLGLPGLDGYEVARQIRSKLDSSVYLVALTGYGQPEDRLRTTAAGFDVHLVKPVEPATLRRLLSEPSSYKPGPQ